MSLRPLRVLVDLTEVRPGGETGGAKYFIYETLHLLGSRPGWAFEFEYLTNSPTHDEVMHELARPCDGVTCVREMNGVAPATPALMAVRERVMIPPPVDLAVRLGVDVAYCPFGSTSLVCPGIPVVTFVADLLHRDYPQTLPHGGVQYREKMFREMVRRTAYFQCNSGYVAGRLHEHYGVPHDRMFHTYNVIHDRLDDGPVVEPPDGCPTGPFFFYPANAWAHKNHEGLIVAYASYRAKHGGDAWPLVLTGHVDDRKRELKQWVQGLLLEDSVLFLGHLSEPQLAAVWRRAGALVFPSLHEGFGIPLLEAMHFSVPIACSNLCSLPEVAGGAAMLFDPRRPAEIASVLDRLSTDREERERLVAEGRRRLGELNGVAETSKLAFHLHRASRCVPEPACAGPHPDGWVSDNVVIGLPEGDNGELSLKFHDHSPRARFVMHSDGRPLGTFAPSDYPDREIRVPLPTGTRSVVFEVEGGENLNPADPRIHGVRLVRIAYETHTGAPPLVLLEHDT